MTEHERLRLAGEGWMALIRRCIGRDAGAAGTQAAARADARQDGKAAGDAARADPGRPSAAGDP